ncbi:AraC-like DNA-binding protein [Ancylomarina subtilis]|uniref:AraC-like DNA-binding protein n=1 Tax=Ancylomarina subtilis TaxID=1639035 RepID=A0A4V2FT15_9BACT|nr:AraC family transcriptional regulator [Ancylomarina subtilis]RZT96375.1 AraC-like DNA-binding protein [Ancylomarina subtilis]
MKAVTIPKDIIPIKNGLPEINLVDYRNYNDDIKNRVFFKQNVISFLIEGHKEIFHEKEPVSISEDKFVIVNASNCLMTEKRSNLTKSYNSILLTYSNESLVAFKTKYKNLISNTHETTGILVLKHDLYTLNFRASLKTLLSKNKTTPQELLQLKFEEILIYLLKTYPNELNSVLSITYSNYELNFKNIIQNNITSGLSIEEFAFLCNQSPSTFKRHFQKYYGTTPKKWLLAERLKIAKSLLENGKKPSEIFFKVGYKTLSNFIKAYKTYYGITPKQQANI